MALVRKILEKTLTAGSTSISFTDSDIPNSLLRVYSSQASLFPISQTLSGNVLTVNYKAQANNVGIALEIVKQGLDIVDNVTSTDTDKALSANQGKVLKDAIDAIVIPTVPENITDLDDVDVTSITNGQVLAWDDTAQKFVNVNQSGGSSNVYSTTETVVGTYNGKPLYRKIISGTFSTVETIVYNQIYVGYITLDLTNVDNVFVDTAHSYYITGTARRGFIGMFTSDNSSIELFTHFERTNASYYITIEYTKTTD